MTNSCAGFDQFFKIIPTSTPHIIRHCARCAGNRFSSSDKFRINANKKVIDVWLIFKCLTCDYTLNIDILSRRPISSIDKKLLSRFYANDKALAWQYAFDASYIERGMTVDWMINFEFEPREGISFPIGDSQKPENLLKRTEKGDKTFTILIKSDFFIRVFALVILRRLLGVNRSSLEKLFSKGSIAIKNLQNNEMTLKNQLGFGCIVMLKI